MKVGAGEDKTLITGAILKKKSNKIVDREKVEWVVDHNRRSLLCLSHSLSFSLLQREKLARAGVWAGVTYISFSVFVLTSPSFFMLPSKRVMPGQGNDILFISSKSPS